MHRPVDCDTQQPIPTYFPGFVNTSIVSDRVETGWGLSSWKGATQALQVPNLGDAAGANATCFTIPSKARIATYHSGVSETCGVLSRHLKVLTSSTKALHKELSVHLDVEHQPARVGHVMPSI